MIAPVMSPPREPSRSPTGAEPPASLLTLREAARLTGLRRRALRERVRRGQVAVRVVAKGRTTKLRLTPDALAAAGLLPDGAPLDLDRSPVGAASELSTALLELVREQNGRIATLEEQRFQLAGQLGAALERAQALEARVLALTAPAPPSAAIDPESVGGTETAARVVPSSPPDMGRRSPRDGEITPAPPRRSNVAASPPRQPSPRPAATRPRPERADSPAAAPWRARWPRRVVIVLRRGAALAAARRGPAPGPDPDPKHPTPNT